MLEKDRSHGPRGSADTHASGAPEPSTPPEGADAPELALARLPTLGLGIHAKLVGLMVAMTLVLVVPLATYFPAREIDGLRAMAHERALVYANLASRQLRSAVAFEDRETAREVLGAIGKDPLIDGIAVYTLRGDAIDTEGTLSEPARSAGRLHPGKTESFYLKGRVLAIAPIESLEGAKGTVVLELSTRAAHELQQRLVLAALSLGGAVLLVGVACAWLIARSLSRRIEVIAEGASAMARGELQYVVDTRGPNDELGLLAHGFNAMSRKVGELVAHIQSTAREQSARLEKLVSQRTEQLKRKNSDLRLVLDNVDQGFVTVDRDARVVGEYSQVIRRWLGSVEAERSLWSQLAPAGSRALKAFEMAWEQVALDVLPAEAALGQMPQKLVLNERHLSFEYRALGGDPFERVLVVISDVTAVVAREASEAESRDLVNLTTRLLKDREGFEEFFGEASRLVQSIDSPATDRMTLKRDLHTLKGNTALYGLTRLSNACHALETALDDQTPESLDPGPLTRAWQQCVATTQHLLGEQHADTIEIDESEYEAVLAAIRRNAPSRELERIVRAWRLEPLRARLDRIAEQLVSTAARLGKGVVAVEVKAGDVYLERDELKDFWAAFSHVVRNAAVHGLESRELRQRKGIEGRPAFGLVAGVEKDCFFVELADFGPGIDWNGIRRCATARGIPHDTQAELEEALFADGISTQAELSELAGRGVGLSAVRAACRRKHGSVRVTTAAGVGTKFRFSWPASEFPSLMQTQRGAVS
jgi:two-component system chemotaxis sensor kinase CheA